MRLQTDNGFTLIELLIVVAIIGIIAAIAVPGLLRARIAGNEASAIGSMRTINSSNLNYMTNCLHGAGYAQDLGSLGQSPTAGGQPFISSDLGVTGTINKSGYGFVYASGGTAQTPTAPCITGHQGYLVYLVTAAPISTGTTGMRYFGTNQVQTLFEHDEAITDISVAGVPTPAAAVPIK